MLKHYLSKFIKHIDFSKLDFVKNIFTLLKHGSKSNLGKLPSGTSHCN